MLCAHSGIKILEAAPGGDLTLKGRRKAVTVTMAGPDQGLVPLPPRSGPWAPGEVSPPDPWSLSVGTEGEWQPLACVQGPGSPLLTVSESSPCSISQTPSGL